MPTTRRKRRRRLLLTAVALGQDIGVGILARGGWMTTTWLVLGLIAAYLILRPRRRRHLRAVNDAGLGGHLLGGLLVAGVEPGPVLLLERGAAGPVALGTAVGLAAWSFASGWGTGPARTPWRIVVDASALGAIALLTSLTLHGPWLMLGFSVQALSLVRIARRCDDTTAAVGAALLLIAAGVDLPVAVTERGEICVGAPDPGDIARILGVQAAAVGAHLRSWMPVKPIMEAI